jgi:hypothetical protein
VIYQIDPIKDQRWSEFVKRHASASVFHSAGWLKALCDTYGYEPLVFTTSSPTSALANGLVFCRVKSWLTGSRIVSLPFSDHCEPLCDSEDDLAFLMRYLGTAFEHQRWKYIEIRPLNGRLWKVSDIKGFTPTARYFRHLLDLRPTLDELFQNLHRNSVQRRVRRAERAGLVEKCGRSKALLKDFYSLFVATRSRHHLPPMPYSWFRNLVECQGDALDIRLAYKDDVPISAVLTLRFKDTVLYKYGCSSSEFNRFGATPWLLWNAIAAAKSSGAVRFDMGRTEEDNIGLLEFKNHWVPQPQALIYLKFPETLSFDSANGWKLKMAKRVFSFMPKSLLQLTGRLLYRHVG